MDQFERQITEGTSKIKCTMETILTTEKDSEWKNEEQEVTLDLPNGTTISVSINKLCDYEEETTLRIHNGKGMRTVIFHGNDDKVTKKKEKLSNWTKTTEIRVE